MSGVRLPRELVEPHAEAVVGALRPFFRDVIVCGSLRRGDSTVGDVDVVASGPLGDVPPFSELLSQKGYSVKTISDGQEGPRRCYEVSGPTVQVPSLRVDVWVVPRESLGAATLYCTGPGMLNTVMRRYATKKGMKLGLCGVDDGAKNVGASEEECFARLGWAFVPPEERSDWRRIVEPYLGEIS